MIKHTNHLINENSPYLLQHAYNPVHWFPWGMEVLDKAKKEDKLIIVSIGYSACHWCHVMEKESFENEEIAEIMNEHYICIKVDREEHPDVDQIYMTAVQLITGRGGWPLNCIAIPDASPVFGGTYFRPDDWKNLLLDIAEQYKSNKQRFYESAKSIQQGIKQSEFIFDTEKSHKNETDQLSETIKNINHHFDFVNGGFNIAPKFPLPSFWHFILEYSYYFKDNTIQKQLELTLDKIAAGGIFDQIGGGFARYSTDRFWKVPHFEKMLYDNAQLLSLYCHAYLLTEKETYKKVALQTADFILNEMTSSENAFYSAFDADSEGIEGKYYIWKKEEIIEILRNDSALFCDFFSVTQEGNWEHGYNVLHVSQEKSDIKFKYGLSENEFNKKIKILNDKLLIKRNTRIKPGLDDKSLTSWNAMMISAFIDVYIITDVVDYLIQAEKTAGFIIDKMMKPDYSLFRSYKKGNSKINAFLDDYAFTVDAFIKLFQETGNKKYLTISKHLIDYVNLHFIDKENGMFFYTSDIDHTLIQRQKEISDNVIPSSNSVMAKNLRKAGIIFSNSELIKQSERMLQNIRVQMMSNIEYFGNWASLLLQEKLRNYELIITGENCIKLKNNIIKGYRPDILYAVTGEENSVPIFKDRFIEGETNIYVCENNICNLPVKSSEEAIKLIS